VGPGCQRLREKEKGEGKGGPAREAGWWAAWAAWAERGRCGFSFFFFFFFKLHFQIMFQLKFNSNFF
jgi:hypothetical protein